MVIISSLSGPLCHAVVVDRSLETGLVFGVQILLAEQPAIGWPRSAKARLVHPHAVDAHGPGAVNRQAQAGGVERPAVESQGFDATTALIPRVHLNLQRSPLAGHIGIGQVPVVQGVRIEPEHGGSIGPPIEQIGGHSHIRTTASRNREHDFAFTRPNCIKHHIAVESFAAKLKAAPPAGFGVMVDIVLAGGAFRWFGFALNEEILLPVTIPKRGTGEWQCMTIERVIAEAETGLQHFLLVIPAGVNGGAE